jgi:DNA-binding transcriptional ArsR family regulator
MTVSANKRRDETEPVASNGSESDANDGADANDNTAVETLGEQEDSFDKDDVFHLLQNERRRRVLQYLEETDGTVEMGDIAEQVAAWEHDTTVRALSSDQRQRVYIALYQAHLPKLDEAGVIEYNQNRGRVEPTDRIETLTAYLDLSDEDEDESPEHDVDWVKYYLGASAASVLLVGMVSLGAPVFASLSHLVVALGVVVMFTLLSLGQLNEKLLFTDSA